MDNNNKKKKNLLTEDHPDHWEETLLGESFWRDAEQSNQRTHDRLNADHNQTLHTRFPFNIGVGESADTTIEPVPQAHDLIRQDTVKVPPKRSRRLSMGDALGFNRGRTFNFPRRNRSNSRPSGKGSDHPRPRSRSASRAPFRFFSSKAKDQDGSSSTLRADQATPRHPFMEFPGGAAWDLIPRDRKTLALDIFQPMEGNQKVIIPLSINELAPLGEFRNLHVLKLSGMMESYQKHIWHAVWLNPHLEELELDMALAPRLRPKFAGKWPYIKGGWKLPEVHYAEPEYYGYQGEGGLDYRIGIGEYLDKHAIEKAKVTAMAIGKTRNRLSIRILTLSRFIVDADPFLLWFDPSRLKCINFKEDCVDAGFYMPASMRKVTVLHPRPDARDQPIVARKVDLEANLKLMELSEGKKVAEMPYQGRREMLGNEQPRKASSGPNVKGKGKPIFDPAAENQSNLKAKKPKPILFDPVAGDQVDVKKKKGKRVTFDLPDEDEDDEDYIDWTKV
ncbi:hypothetical protein FE257_000122 [Aspergillus nanangensis]|uniref:Uncharacterized protein n=1 Tax=Aspergillus nanangensis TaxID=2582783 RepID=A0AAD4CYS9_ASPNN|nr:hypothetical protein FE257_000122 [Aspergillus nanangensis]